MPITVKYKDTGVVLDLETFIQNDCRAYNWTSNGTKQLSMSKKAVQERNWMSKMRVERPEKYAEIVIRRRKNARERYRKEGETNMVDVVCGWCKTTFRRRASLLKNSKSGNYFCSVHCSQKFASTQNVKKHGVIHCDRCGKILVRTPSEIKRNKTGVFYCGDKCYLEST